MTHVLIKFLGINTSKLLFDVVKSLNDGILYGIGEILLILLQIFGITD